MCRALSNFVDHDADEDGLLDFDCGHLAYTMDNIEGDKISNTVKAAGVVGLSCTD